MGNARGVEIRESGIRLSFAHRGERIRRTLLVEGKAIAPTPANIKYAIRLLAEIKLKIRAGNFVMREYFPEGGTVAAGTTVAHQLDHWLSVKVAENSTLAGYLSAIKFWKPFIGEKQVSALKHSDILRAIKTRPDLSGKTVNNYVSALRSAMDLAVLDKLLTENPVAAVPSAKWQREPPDPFDREEVEQIIDYARKLCAHGRQSDRVPVLLRPAHQRDGGPALAQHRLEQKAVSQPLLGADAQGAGHSLPAAQPYAPHLCDDAAHGRSHAGLCGQADGAFCGDVFERLLQVAGRRSGGYRAGEAGVLHRTKLPRNSPEKAKIAISLCFKKAKLERAMGIEPGSACLFFSHRPGLSSEVPFTCNVSMPLLPPYFPLISPFFAQKFAQNYRSSLAPISL